MEKRIEGNDPKWQQTIYIEHILSEKFKAFLMRFRNTDEIGA